jgi:hypothetical protein
MGGFGDSRTRPFVPPMPDPLAFFLTWTTYGTWLPGDERGWVERGRGFRLPEPIRKREAEARMTEDACILDEEQRKVVEKTIRDHCRIRKWELHAVNCRTNHVHVVVSANRKRFASSSWRGVRDDSKSLSGCEPVIQMPRFVKIGGPNGEVNAGLEMKRAWKRRFSMYGMRNDTLARRASEGERLFGSRASATHKRASILACPSLARRASVFCFIELKTNH